MMWYKGIGGKTLVVGVVLAVLAALPWMAENSQQPPAHYNWSTAMAGTDQLTAVTWDGSQFVAVGDKGAVYTSQDGSGWIMAQPKTEQLLSGVSKGEEKLVVVGPRGLLLSTKDGKDWSRESVKPAEDLSAVTFAPLSDKSGLFVAVGSQGAILTSKKGQDWRGVAAITSSDLNAVAWGGPKGHELFVAVGNGGSVLTSESGRHWAEVRPIPQDLYGVAWGGDRFVAVGQNGVVLVSDDGAKWTPANSGTTFALNAVAWCGSRFVAVGASGTIVTSLDGMNWSSEPSPTTTWLHGVAFSGNAIVVVGESGVVILAPGTSISGKVLRTVTGVGIAGLTVNISGGYPPTTTATDGSYSFTGLASGVYTVNVPDVAGTYLLYPHNRSVDISGGDAININFTAYPIHQVTGNVTFPAGTPTPYPAMTLVFEPISIPVLPASIPMNTTTGAYTTAPGGLPEGAWKVTPQVNTPGPGNYWVFSPQSLSLNLTADAVYNWAAIPSVQILGAIGNTSPCTLDIVDITATAQDGTGAYAASRVDVGAYTITVPQNKAYDVTYTSARGLTPNYKFNPNPQTVHVATTDVPLVLTLGTPYYDVIAHAEYVAPGPTILPLSGAAVSLKQYPGGTLIGTCTTGADGNCTVHSATYNISYTLEATRSGYYFLNSTSWPNWTETLCVANDQTNNPACLLGAIPAFDISGRVTYAGTASGIGGANVSIGGTVPDVTTASDGTYILRNVPVGPYNVTVTKAGYHFSPNPAVVQIVDQSLTGVDFTGVGNYHVTGTVHYITPTTCGTEIPSVTVTATVPGIGSFTYLTTGAGGEFYSIVVPPSSGIVITAARTGYTFLPSQYTVTVTTADQGGNNFTAYCPSSTYSISGRITDPNNNGIPGALVTAGPGLTTTTDGTGNYYFNGDGVHGPALPAGTYLVVPTLAGYLFTPLSLSVTLPCTGTTNCTLGSATNVNFKGQLTYSISGSVTSTGAGATLTATMSGQDPVTTTANAAGAYTIPGLIPGTWRVTPTKAGYTFLGSGGNPYNDVPITNANVGGINFSCNAIPTYTISGIVYDLSSNPVVGATISAGGQSTTSVAGGAYTLTGLVAATYTVTCTYTGLGFNTQTVTLPASPNPPGNATGVNFNAVLGHFISGTVYSGGAGYGGVTMTATQGGSTMGSTTTAANGAYSLGPFANGTFTITPTLAGHSYTPTSQSVSLSGADRTGIDFNETFSVSGQVTLNGSGLAGVYVTTGSTGATTDGSGNYTITGLLPGSYTLTPSLSGYSFTPTSLAITITNSNQTGKNFVASAYFTISGGVLLNSSGLSGVTITVTQSGTPADTQITDSAGKYMTKPLAPNVYVVKPTLTGYTFSPTSQSVTLSTGDATGISFTATTSNPAPTVTTISPSSGGIAGGDSVTITGTGFLTGATVTFDTSPATAVVVASATSITCKTPAHAAGSVDVTVKNADNQSATVKNGFTYNSTAPVVTNVNPAQGPSTGGTKVTITGTGFTGATAVTFGANAATAFSVDGPLQITATSPPGTAGTTVDVRVTTANGTSAVTTVGKFTYNSPSVISIVGVTPGSGPVAGGTSVTITGTGFLTGVTVTFDTTAATSVVLVSNTQITCSTPAHAAGTVDVTVKNTDNQSATLVKGYTYGSPAPTITNVNPGKGSTLGQTTVTILGSNFATGAAVSFGGTAATSVNVVNPATITCVTPAHSAGAVNVVVTNADGGAATLSSAFTYISPPVVTAVKKYTDPFRLKLNGSNFHTSCVIKINGVVVPATDYKQSTKVFAKGGSTLKAMVPKGVTVQITVVNVDDGITSNPIPYRRD